MGLLEIGEHGDQPVERRGGVGMPLLIERVEAGVDVRDEPTGIADVEMVDAVGEPGRALLVVRPAPLIVGEPLVQDRLEGRRGRR